MSSNNPLRPYYDHDTFNAGYSVIFRPGVGLIDTQTNKPITSLLTSSVSTQNTASADRGFVPGKGIGLNGSKGFGDLNGGKTIGSGGSDKNYAYDLEFQEYFDFNNLSELLKNLVYNFCKNYLKVVLSQPLEIVRLVLQVGYFQFDQKLDSKDDHSSKKEPKKYSRLLNPALNDSTPQITDISESDSDSEINYFQSTGDSVSFSRSTMRDSSVSHRNSTKKSNRTPKNANKIQPISKHTIDIMTAIATKDGPIALFRGINAQFIHQTLSHTIEAWITGFISPFLGIPDPFFLDLTHSTDPLRSLWLSVSACVLTGFILMPLDLIKVRLMITQFNKPFGNNSSSSEPPSSVDSSDPDVSAFANSTHVNRPPIDPTAPRAINTRSIRDSIRNYPISLVLNPPPTIALLTVLHQFSTSVFRKAAPYIMYIRFNLDGYSSSNLYTLVNLWLLIMEFFIKLPVENLLRKEQVRFLLKPKSLAEDEKRVVSIDNPEEDLIVDFNSWNLHDAIYDSESEEDIPEDEKKSLTLVKAGGIAGFAEKVKRLNLFNGWRVGVLNIIGYWGYNILKSNNTSTLREEKL